MILLVWSHQITNEFFKKYQNLMSTQDKLNLNFLKNSRVQINLKLNEKSRMITYLIIAYRKNLRVDQLPEVRVHVCFVECLENFGKCTGECKKQHFNKFSKFLKIFGDLWKSLEIFGKKLENVAKC